MADTTEESWWQSPRMWVGVTALTDLVVRAPEDIIIPILSLFGGLLGGPSIGFVTTWLFAAVVLYSFAPLAYSLSDVLPREDPGFRAIFSGGGVAVGISMTTYSLLVSLKYMILLLLIGGGIMLWYLSWEHEWDLLDPHGPVSDILDLFNPYRDATAAMETDLKPEGIYRLYYAGSYLLASALVMGLPIILAGAVTLVFSVAYPVPDLLFLGWVVGAATAARVSVGPSKDQVLDLQFDLERYLVDAIENVTRGAQGICLTAVILFGMLVAAIYFSNAIVLIPWFSFATGLLGLWNYVGAIAVLVSAGGFALWAWIRELQRLPYFLDQWEGRETTTGQPVSRPPGLVALPAVGVTVVLAMMFLGADLNSGSILGYLSSNSLLGYVFAVSWPVLVGACGMAGLRTYKQSPQPVAYENYWIGGGVLLECLSLTPATQGYFATVDLRWFVIVIAGTVFLTGYPVVKRYAMMYL